MSNYQEKSVQTKWRKYKQCGTQMVDKESKETSMYTEKEEDTIQHMKPLKEKEMKLIETFAIVGKEDKDDTRCKNRNKRNEK